MRWKSRIIRNSVTVVSLFLFVATAVCCFVGTHHHGVIWYTTRTGTAYSFGYATRHGFTFGKVAGIVKPKRGWLFGEYDLAVYQPTHVYYSPNFELPGITIESPTQCVASRRRSTFVVTLSGTAIAYWLPLIVTGILPAARLVGWARRRSARKPPPCFEVIPVTAAAVPLARSAGSPSPSDQAD
jgi:hypothetical protein